MTTPTERFDATYERIKNYDRAVNLTHALGTYRNGITVSLAAAEGIHVDDAKRPTSRAIGMVISHRIINNATGTFGKVTDRVELYRDAEGEVIANYTGRADIFNRLSSGANHGYPDKEFDVPEHSAELALNSALTTVELALDQHEALEAPSV